MGVFIELFGAVLLQSFATTMNFLTPISAFIGAVCTYYSALNEDWGSCAVPKPLLLSSASLILLFHFLPWCFTMTLMERRCNTMVVSLSMLFPIIAISCHSVAIASCSSPRTFAIAGLVCILVSTFSPLLSCCLCAERRGDDEIEFGFEVQDSVWQNNPLSGGK
jgi:hypothetical protein